MPYTPPADRAARRSVQLARFTTGTFALALLAWGIAPALMHSFVNRELPPFTLVSPGGLTLVIGALFMLLSVLIGRAPWALPTTLVAAGVLFAANLTLTVLHGTLKPSLFPLLLTLATATTCWLAIDAQRVRQRPGRSPQPE